MSTYFSSFQSNGASDQHDPGGPAGSPQSGDRRGPRTLRDYVGILRRRKVTLLLTTLVVVVAAVGFSLTQEKQYEATAQVLISRQNIANDLNNVQTDQSVAGDADRLIQTQALIARSPTVAQRAVAGTPNAPTFRQLLDNSTVTARPDTDIVTFTVTDHDPALAKRLATRYAVAFTRYRRKLDTTALQRAIDVVGAKLDSLARRNESKSKLYNSLAGKQQRLLTLEALQTSNAFVTKTADSADQVRPKPLRNGIIGLFVGLLLGLVGVFVREALDARLRSGDEVEERLGLPLLARLPAPPPEMRKTQELSMLRQPEGPAAEAFRLLRTNLDFRMLHTDVSSVMVTSAVEAEGKSTTVGNLAVAMAREGRDVTLVDLDLRRPMLSKFMHLEPGAPGVTEVVLGRATLEDALIRVEIPPAAGDDGSAVSAGDGHGVLSVMPAGVRPPDVGEFVGSAQLAELVARIKSRGDLVLIDAPPVLRVSDALSLSRLVEGVIVVARLKVVQRRMIDDLNRSLDTMPAKVLGFCLAGADDEQGAYYGGYYSYGYGYADQPAAGLRGRLTGRRAGTRA